MTRRKYIRLRRQQRTLFREWNKAWEVIPPEQLNRLRKLSKAEAIAHLTWFNIIHR